jgi:hypothetical protein
MGLVYKDHTKPSSPDSDAFYICRTHPLQDNVEVFTSPSPSLGRCVLRKLWNNVCGRQDSNLRHHGIAYTSKDYTTLPQPQNYEQFIVVASVEIAKNSLFKREIPGF